MSEAHFSLTPWPHRKRVEHCRQPPVWKISALANCSTSIFVQFRVLALTSRFILNPRARVTMLSLMEESDESARFLH